MRILRALVLLATLGIVSVLFGTYAVAQGWNCDPTLQSIVQTDEHLKALLRAIREWETSNIVLAKETANSQFNSGINRQYSTNDPESMLQRTRQTAWWNQLPAVSQNQARISVTCGAKLVLVGALADKLPDYRQLYSERGGSDPFVFLMENFQGSLYMIIASAEHERILADRSEIDATTLQRGGLWLFSLGWPFCCAYQN